MNWLLYQGGWVVVVGLVCAALSVRYVSQSQWVGAIFFALAAALQFIYGPEIQAFFDFAARSIRGGLDAIL